MTPIRLALVVVIGAVGDALFPAGLFKAVLGLPPLFCPTGSLAAGISLAHLAAVAVFVFVWLSAIRQVAVVGSDIVVAATVGAVVASALLGWSFDQVVFVAFFRATLVTAGAVWEGVRWLKALGTGVGALVGIAIWSTLLQRRAKSYGGAIV